MLAVLARRAGIPVNRGDHRLRLKLHRSDVICRPDPLALFVARHRGTDAVSGEGVPRILHGLGSRRVSDVDEILELNPLDPLPDNYRARNDYGARLQAG